MTVKLDIQEFVRDYCNGVKDKDLLARHHVNPKELMGIVRKLINDGFITKEQYFDRNRVIHELEAREEKNFLKSLYHCPVCSHIHPSPFTICPACGADITKEPEQVEKPHHAKTEDVESPAQAIVDANAPASVAPVPVPQPPPQAAVAFVPPSHADEEQLPDELQAIIEAPLESVSPIGESIEEIASASYDIVEAMSHNQTSSTFKALDSSGQGPDISVKLFHPDSLPDESVPELLSKVSAYQSAMQDTNIIKIIGLAVVDGREVLIYEHMPTNLEALLRDHPGGLPLELVMEVLPQILNAVGYSHMHRGTDGIARRLPHMGLRPEAFLFDPGSRLVKLDECGLWKSLVEIRGLKRHIWEEPAADPAVLAPECFVLDSKSVNPFLADIYALGATLYRLATGKRPFLGTTTEDYQFAHLRTFPVPPRVHRWQIPGWLDRMILKCLEKEPAHRWRSATQMELAIGKGFK